MYDQFCLEEICAEHGEDVVHVSSQLRRRGIVGRVQAEPNSTSYRCFETLLIGRAGKVKLHHAGDAYNSLERTTAL